MEKKASQMSRIVLESDYCWNIFLAKTAPGPPITLNVAQIVLLSIRRICWKRWTFTFLLPEYLSASFFHHISCALNYVKITLIFFCYIRTYIDFPTRLLFLDRSMFLAGTVMLSCIYLSAIPHNRIRKHLTNSPRVYVKLSVFSRRTACPCRPREASMTEIDHSINILSR